MISFAEIKYWLADRLFEKELDDAYAMGVRYGTDFAMNRIRFRLNLSNQTQELTKANRVGFDKAVSSVTNTCEEIRETARLLK